MAVMNQSGNVSKKLEKPVNYEVPKGYTEHFLDHKV